LIDTVNLIHMIDENENKKTKKEEKKETISMDGDSC
jgi:hypothetical protein